MGLQLRNVIEEHDDGPFAFAGDTGITQLLNDCFQAWVVKALAERVIELNSEPGVHRFKLLLRSAIISHQMARFSGSPF